MSFPNRTRVWVLSSDETNQVCPRPSVATTSATDLTSEAPGHFICKSHSSRYSMCGSYAGPPSATTALWGTAVSPRTTPSTIGRQL